MGLVRIVVTTLDSLSDDGPLPGLESVVVIDRIGPIGKFVSRDWLGLIRNERLNVGLNCTERFGILFGQPPRDILPATPAEMVAAYLM